MFATLYVATFLALAGATQPASQSTELQAGVDPRVELLSIVFRLAGNPEYNQPNSKSPYSAEVEAHFGPFRDHAVIQMARKLRSEHGVSFDAVMGLAVHITPPPELGERMPFEPRPRQLDERWQAEDARAFLGELRKFAAETKFAAFFAGHEKLYAQAGERMARRLNERPYLKWFEQFFGARPGARFRVIVGLLNGGGNYGVSVRFPDGSEEITPILGVWEFDADGVPVIADSITSLVVHEFGHSFTNPLVNKHERELLPAAEKIYPLVHAAMQEQAYGNAKTMLYESLVRACVVRYLLATDGKAAAQQDVQKNVERGFRWIGDLAELLGKYEADRKQYPTLDAFMPRVAEFFEQQAERVAAQDRNAPHVEKMVPANGATDVDPNLTEMVITFDRPMQNQSWSVVGGGEHFPEIVGKPAYDKTRRVLTVHVKLKPNWEYQLWLNRNQFQAFRSADGVPLESVPVTFKTRGR
jgi:hypothetical protein